MTSQIQSQLISQLMSENQKLLAQVKEQSEQSILHVSKGSHDTSHNQRHFHRQPPNIDDDEFTIIKAPPNRQSQEDEHPNKENLHTQSSYRGGKTLMFDHRTRGGATVGRGYRDSNQREFGENHRGFESNGRGQRGGRNTFENFKKRQSYEDNRENH